MADSVEVIANRFTMSSSEERKEELRKFIVIKEARVEALKDELQARQDELALLRSQYAVIVRAEKTEQWLTGDMDPSDPLYAELNEAFATVDLAGDERRVDGKEKVSSDSGIPPMLPPRTPSQGLQTHIAPLLQSDSVLAIAPAAEEASSSEADARRNADLRDVRNAVAAPPTIANESDDDSSAFLPPVFPSRVVEEIRAEAARARHAAVRGHVAPVPAEFSNVKWLDAPRLRVHVAVQAAAAVVTGDQRAPGSHMGSDDFRPANFAVAAQIGEAAADLLHALIYGLGQFKAGWSKVPDEAGTIDAAKQMTAETFLGAKSEADSLGDAAANGVASNRTIAAIETVRKALGFAFTHIAEVSSPRATVIHAMEAVDSVAEAAVSALHEVHAVLARNQ